MQMSDSQTGWNGSQWLLPRTWLLSLRLSPTCGIFMLGSYICLKNIYICHSCKFFLLRPHFILNWGVGEAMFLFLSLSWLYHSFCTPGINVLPLSHGVSCLLFYRKKALHKFKNKPTTTNLTSNYSKQKHTNWSRKKKTSLEKYVNKLNPLIKQKQYRICPTKSQTKSNELH